MFPSLNQCLMWSNIHAPGYGHDCVLASPSRRSSQMLIRNMDAKPGSVQYVRWNNQRRAEFDTTFKGKSLEGWNIDWVQMRA